MHGKNHPHGIDITAPGGITALMDFHRLTFGDAVMEADAGTADAGAAAGAADAGAAAGTDATGGAAADAGAAAGAADAGQGAENVDQLPAWAQKIIRDTRKEAGDNRAKATTAETNAEARVNAMLEAAGIKTKDEPLDAAKLTEQLSAKDQAIRNLTVERALDKAARRAGADEDLLTAVLAHKGSLGKLDPTADDFATQLDALVKAEVAGNPKLKAARAAGASGIELSGGTGEQGQITAAQLAHMTAEQIVEADRKGLLRDYKAS
ncbi:MAG: hypothetical protein M3O29_08135 [Actinomycetota bacterium]|nr:hypothetical protein [Actinomycetota bacterium]